MADKCVVCGYTFQRKDRNEATGNFICPYCGTEKRTYSSSEDFDRKMLITDGYDYLSKSDMKSASEKFHTYSSKYRDQSDDQLALGEAMAKLHLSASLNYDGTKFITVVHEGSLDGVLESPHFKTIMEKNGRIYENVLELAEHEKDITPEPEAVMLISADADAAERLSSLLENHAHVLDVDITADDAEARIYRNIPSAKALVVYVDDEAFLKNAYFMSVYYRFQKRGKSVIFVCENPSELDPMFESDHKADYHDEKLLDSILIGMNQRMKEDSKEEEQGYLLKGSEITEIHGKDVSLPTLVVSISPMAAYQKEIHSVTVTTSGVLQIGERAFSESTLESFTVQAKACNLELGREVFSKCKALKSLAFSNQDIRFKDDGQFRDCISLRDVDLSHQALNEIPDHCFDGCVNLESASLPNNVGRIGRYAFRGTKLHSIALLSDTVIGEDAFCDCALSEVHVSEGASVSLEVSEDTFPQGCRIILSGKGLKKLYKDLKKNFKDSYSIEFEK